MTSENSTHAQNVHRMFSSIAKNYDKANSVISLGMHHRWRELCVKRSDAKSGDSVLDLATGTGDLAISFKKALGRTSKVLGTDYCAPMMQSAPLKAHQLGLQIPFEEADATKLQYPDESFNIVSISFGLRNVDDRPKAIKEMARVAKKGGRVMILDTGSPKNPIIRFLFRLYFSKIMPWLGALVGHNQQAYQYLFTSSEAFPSGDKLKEELIEHGAFSKVEYWPLAFGSAYLYKATK